MGDIPATIELDDGWRELKVCALDKLESIIESGFGKGRLFSNQEYAAIYTLCYNMCNQKIPCNWSEDLYERHRETVENYLKRKVRPAVKHRNGEFLLKEFVRRTDNHKVMIKWMSKFFLYLDRHYVSNGQHASIESVGLDCFRSIVYEDVKQQVSSALMVLIENEREGQVIDRDLIRSCLLVFELMGRQSYVNDFENQFLTETSSFYQTKSADWIAHDSTPAYINRVEQCMNEEVGRVNAYMIAASTEQKLVKTIEDTLIIGQVPELLHREGSGCKAMLHNDSLRDLACMFKLFASVERLTPMAEVFKNFVISLGEARMDKLNSTNTNTNTSTNTSAAPGGDDEEAVAATTTTTTAAASATTTTTTTGVGAEENAKVSSKSGKGGKADPSGNAAAVEEEAQFVKDLLGLHDKYLKMVEDQFSSNVIFQKAFNDAFNDLINRSIAGSGDGRHKMAEMLCSFCDRLLKTGSSEKVESDEQAELILSKVVQLFFYLQDKDVFAEVYRNQLAKRLLNQRSASDELEKFVVGKLKMKCGAQFTSKLEGMLSDLSLVTEHMQGFRELFTEQQASSSPSVSGIDYNVQLLTAGYWPTYKSFDVTLPPVMQRCTEIFKEFYDAKNPQRRLQWVHTLGSVTMKCTFGSKSYDIQISTLQAAVLCSFPAAATSAIKKISSDTKAVATAAAGGGGGTAAHVDDDATVEQHSKRIKSEVKEDNMIQAPDNSAATISSTTTYNSHDVPIPFSVLLESLGMSEETLKRVLHSLSCGKFRVLKKIANYEGNSAGGSSGDKIIRSTDSFQVNDKFTSPVRKFRIPMANLDESANEKRVEEDRTTAIEAAIVRIMKARKVLAHQQLIAEVLAQLIFFRPDPKTVKRRIEALIDREYLERDEHNPTMYKYLA